MALICDWCRDPIRGDEPETRLQLVQEGNSPLARDRVVLRGWPTFHEDCGIMALYAATEAIEDAAPGERPDPTSDELLEHIPTTEDRCKTEPDGPLSARMRLVRQLGERSVWYTLYEAGIGTLLDASFHTRKDLAAIPGVGRTTLDQLEAAMRRHGLSFAGQVREAVA